MSSERIVIVFAGGSGTRMGGSVPKQFIEIMGKPVLAWTLEVFQAHSDIDGIILVVSKNFLGEAKALCARYGIDKIRAYAESGDSAQSSIYNGLKTAASMCKPETIVLLNDGVRPYIDAGVISAVIGSVEAFGNGVTYTPCYETIVLSGDGKEISAIPSRNESYTAQAPQGFRLGDLIRAHDRVRNMPNGYEGLVDQATLYWKLGLPIHLVPGNRGNIKITTPEDVAMIEALLKLKQLDSNDA